MADIGEEYKKDLDKMAEPAESESEILGDNSVKREALDTKKEIQASTAPKEEKLPKLSLADFRVYNSMSEHMEYFVC